MSDKKIDPRLGGCGCQYDGAGHLFLKQCICPDANGEPLPHRCEYVDMAKQYAARGEELRQSADVLSALLRGMAREVGRQRGLRKVLAARYREGWLSQTGAFLDEQRELKERARRAEAERDELLAANQDVGAQLRIAHQGVGRRTSEIVRLTTELDQARADAEQGDAVVTAYMQANAELAAEVKHVRLIAQRAADPVEALEADFVRARAERDELRAALETPPSSPDRQWERRRVGLSWDQLCDVISEHVNAYPSPDHPTDWLVAGAAEAADEIWALLALDAVLARMIPNNKDGAR